MNQKQLENKIIRLSRNIKKGDSFELLYNGSCIANYEFEDWAFDSKTPLEWLRGCIVFLVTLQNRDIEKVQLIYSKK